MTKTLTKTEAAQSIALQVVVHARKAAQHQIDQGLSVSLDGKTIIEEILSEAAGGHMGEYLRQCAEATCIRTVRIHVKRYIKG